MSTQQSFMNVVEAALLAAGRPLEMSELLALFEGDPERPDRKNLREIIGQLQEDWAERSLELVEVANGYRFQVRAEYAPWMGRLWTERPPRYSRALMETLALIAYRQPITRPEIEDVRGVSVSTSIVKTLMEREWIRVYGHRDVPGRPALYGTTKDFLDAFGLKSLDDLPPLSELKDIENLHADLFSGLEANARASTEGGRAAPESQLHAAEPSDQSLDLARGEVLVQGAEDLVGPSVVPPVAVAGDSGFEASLAEPPAKTEANTDAVGVSDDPAQGRGAMDGGASSGQPPAAASPRTDA